MFAENTLDILMHLSYQGKCYNVVCGAGPEYPEEIGLLRHGRLYME